MCFPRVMPSPHDPLSAEAELERLWSQKRLVESQLSELLKREPSFAPHAAASFEVLEELGRGGFGVVQRVRDRRLDREAALKMPLESAADRGSGLRLEREARLLARMAHPAIPALYEAGRTASGHPYLLMPVLEGRGLDALLQESGPGRRHLLQVLLRVSEAVTYAHSQKVLHRDLKPSNVLVGDFGEVFVIDWGLGRVKDEDTTVASEPTTLRGLTQEGEVLGTPGYQSPEQAKGELLDESADVFALGAMLTEILTGRLPVKGSNSLNRSMATIKGEIRTPGEMGHSVPKALEELAARSLAYEPRDRLRSARAFADALEAYLNNGPAPRRWPWLLGLSAIALLIATLAWPSAPRPRPPQAGPRAPDPRLAKEERGGEAAPKESDAEVLEEAWQALFAGEEAKVRDLIDGYGDGEALAPLEQVKLGRVRMWLADFERAERCFNSAAKEPAGEHAALLFLHESEILRFPFDPFRKTPALDRLLEIRAPKPESDSRYLLVAEGVRAFYALNYSKALSCFLRVRSFELKSFLLNVFAFYSDRILGHFKGQRRRFGSISDLPPTVVGELTKSALHRIDRDKAKAKLHLDRARLAATRPELAHAEAYLLVHLGLLSEARARLSEAPAQDPHTLGLKASLASGRQQAAQLRAALKRFPDHPFLNRLCLSAMNSEVFSPREGLPSLELLKEQSPLSVPVLNRLLEVYSQQGRRSDCLAVVERRMRVAPSDVFVYLAAASFHRSRGDSISAISLLSVGLAKVPNTANQYYELWIARGVESNNLKRYRAALSDLTWALRLAPLEPIALGQRAAAFFGLGRYQEARDDLMTLEVSGRALTPSQSAMASACREKLDKR